MWRKALSLASAVGAIATFINIIRSILRGTVRIPTATTDWVIVWADSPIGFIAGILLLVVCVAGFIFAAIDLYRPQ